MPRCKNDCFEGIYWKQGVPILCNCEKEEEIVPRQVVKWFSEQMEKKLQENDHKKSWTEYEDDYLITRMEQEMDELMKAIIDLKYGKGSPEEVIKEAADVSNISMFIADKSKRLINDPGWGERGI